MKNTFFKKFVVLLTTILGTPCYSEDINDSTVRFKIEQKPSTADWRFFMEASPSWKQSLWLHYHEQKYQLSDWAWGWRIGWLKYCGEDQREWCRQILKDGLKDKALVVRSQAVQALGSHYINTKNPTVVHDLSSQFRDKSNQRGGKPLFIHEKILFAIKLIGGEKNLAQAKLLAQNFTSTQIYWTKLSKVH